MFLDPMQAGTAHPSMPEPAPESSGMSEGLERSHLNNEVLERFAQNMSEDIIQSFVSQMETVEPEVDCGVSMFNQNQEMLAEELASAVIEVALREACAGQNVEDQSLGSAGVEADDGQPENLTFMDESERDFLNMDAEIQTSRDIQLCHAPRTQSALPVMGSLDYPDAPPTTPLHPELERSRSSFARRLKGGLAKVFLPSPPPPTPKDGEDDSDSAADDPRVALMEHLMHSLPTDDLARDYFEVGPHNGAQMEAFAEALSCDILDWVLSAKNQELITEDTNLHLLAHQLAQTIISSSLDEVKILV